MISWRGSTFKSFAIFTSISRDGCVLLKHHMETVATFLPICSTNHFPVLPFSTQTAFNLLVLEFPCALICLFVATDFDMKCKFNYNIWKMPHYHAEKNKRNFNACVILSLPNVAIVLFIYRWPYSQGRWFCRGIVLSSRSQVKTNPKYSQTSNRGRNIGNLVMP